MLNLANILTRWIGFPAPANASPRHACAVDDGLQLDGVVTNALAGPPRDRGRLVEGLADIDEFLDVFPAEARGVAEDVPAAATPPTRSSAWMLDAEPMEVCLPDGEMVTVWVELGLSDDARRAIARNLARTFSDDVAPVAAPTARRVGDAGTPQQAAQAASPDTHIQPHHARQRPAPTPTGTTTRLASPRKLRKRTRRPLLAAQ